ncbi:MAG: DEAD/DEAH box helicase [Deltaproteobacteria bacterium]|nr:DEAD/DEAH box helicase [Deltaproteobacteria bacterium]
MGDLLNALRKFDALRDGEAGGDLVDQRSLESIAPTYAKDSVIEGLGEELRAGLKERGIARLYQHQSDAIVHALEGAHVVLQAPTASGKTLAFQIPMLESLRQPGAHALMLYPTKALALDQREQLSRLTSVMPGGEIDSWWYDGDTDAEHRTLLRKNPPRILITNPDMLHNSFLGHAEQWSKFLAGLKWVIVDEMHEYRGYFGSNVAMILRRFSYHLASLGVRPQFFMSSATCANAREHAENLTGLKFVEVNASGGMRPQREFVFVRPNIPAFQYWDILQVRTVMAGLACLAEGKSVLAFCPTRKFAEACYPIAMRELQKHTDAGEPLVDPSAVRVFRAGLAVEERHAVQEGLKRGEVKLVFTTNALEMGIDIGGLDGIIMAGFPDSMMSAWQRIGRAGRTWDAEAFVLYFARNNPLDQFYAANLKGFLTKPLDNLVVNAENEDLVEKHLGSLLFETPVLTDDAPILGSAMKREARAKVDSGVTAVKSGRWRPHPSLNIRGGGAGMFVLKEGNREIGTLSAHQQFREAYQRAIYMHGGRSYRVKEVALKGGGGEIVLESADPWLRTHASTFTFVSEQDIFAGRRWVGEGTEVNAFYGKVLITESLNSVQELNERTGDVLDQWTPQSNSAQFKNAHAFWVQEQRPTDVSAAAINAFQQLLRVGALFSVPLDAHDIFSHAVPKEQKAYVVESYPGGIGIAKKVLESWREVLGVGVKIALACACGAGCPNCIVPPRSTDDMDKVGAVEFAEALLRATRDEASGVFRGGLWMPVATV